jgi:D-xylose 1-dehydrogenase (NADP+, D-xylono-1,5-lactone-forming)
VDHNETRQVRWGILGCAGVAATVIVPGIRLSRNGTVSAVASRNKEKARAFADKFGIPVSYGSYEDLLSDPAIEAVYIPLPNSMHKEWTIRAAESGKHVLCEKPLASNAPEALEMVEACAKNNVRLMEAFAHRFHPHNVLAKQLIEEGRIGRPLGYTGVHSSPPPASGNIRLSKELGGGVLEDKGCYCVNTARFIFGMEPLSVFATVQLGETGVDERVTALLEFPNQAKAFFDTSFLLTDGTYQQGYEVLGETGRIVVPFGFTQVETYRRGEIIDTWVYVTDKSNRVEKIDLKGIHQWQLQVEYFADRILNHQPVSFPGEDGLMNMRVMDAIYQSSREGRPVSVDSSRTPMASSGRAQASG